MSEVLLVAAVALVCVSGAPGLFTPRASSLGERLSAALMALGSLAGITAGALVLATGRAASIDRALPVPGARFALHVDAISAMFLVQIFLIAGLGAIYGLSYWRDAEHPESGRNLRIFYGLVTGGLALVVTARNSFMFLFGWELMAIPAFFLVTTEDREAAAREAGLLYLVATRLGTLCLYAFFALLHTATGTFDFAVPAGQALSPHVADALFALGLVGFGLKAGLMPLHVWLPSAHANAPSHVSALMSGVLIKTGVYGLVRVTSLVEHPPLWWGATLFGLGVASGVLGVAFAIGQHDIKRLLAYHSVENIGIIVMGLGLAVMGRSLGAPELVALGLAGALLHTWNHGLFKALLFLGAGAVAHATGTREIDRLGGLSRAMPRTAITFLIGAVAISGLPPLNGFVSEFLLYLAMLRSTALHDGRAWLGAALGAPALALIGGLAAACFVKVYGAVFLGSPRSEATAHAHEPDLAMRAPMYTLAGLCVFIGLAPRAVTPALDRAVAAWTEELTAPHAVASIAPLGWITAMALSLVALVVASALFLRWRSPRSEAATTVTWDCGYAAPSRAMQYTASSFADTLVGLFAGPLQPRAHAPVIEGAFPAPSSFHSEVGDTVHERAVLPVIERVSRALGWFRWMQQGSVHAYILYVLVAMIVSLVVWR